MAELKTKVNDSSVADFINSLQDEKKRKDAHALLKVFTKATGEEPKMWGDTIVGFGSYHYKYASGREGDWMLAGFSPRKQNFALYLMIDLQHYEKLLKDLGKHKTGKSCIYIKKMEDIDSNVLTQLIKSSVDELQAGSTT
jgi:hypothetical protein